MNSQNKHIFNPITLSEVVVVSDPCYSRGTWCAGTVNNMLPGTYVPMIVYSSEGYSNGRVAQLIVHHESVTLQDLKKGTCAKFIVGVDSGQAGIFCDSIYPHEENTGEYSDKTSFYGQCCEATTGEGYDSKQRRFMLENELKHVQAVHDTLNECEDKEAVENRLKYNTIRLDMVKKQLAEHVDIPWTKAGLVFGKGVVSSSGWGDGSYRCYLYKKDGKVVGIRIYYI